METYPEDWRLLETFCSLIYHTIFVRIHRIYIHLKIISNQTAILKSESNVNKQIEDLKALIASKNQSTDDKINSIIERQTRSEGNLNGAQVNQSDRRQDNTGFLGHFYIILFLFLFLLCITSYTTTATCNAVYRWSQSKLNVCEFCCETPAKMIGYVPS